MYMPPHRCCCFTTGAENDSGDEENEHLLLVRELEIELLEKEKEVSVY